MVHSTPPQISGGVDVLQGSANWDFTAVAVQNACRGDPHSVNPNESGARRRITCPRWGTDGTAVDVAGSPPRDGPLAIAPATPATGQAVGRGDDARLASSPAARALRRALACDPGVDRVTPRPRHVRRILRHAHLLSQNGRATPIGAMPIGIVRTVFAHHACGAGHSSR